MSDTEKAFQEIRTLTEALQIAVETAENRAFVNNTQANHAAATFMGTAQWMLVELGKATLEGRLIERLVELQQEFQAIFDQLACSPRGSH